MTEKKESNLKRILSNTGWMLFDKLFILVLNFVVTVRIANHYGASTYGTYEYAISVIAIIEILVAFVDARVVKKRYLNENPSELVWNATITRMIFSFIALIIGIIFICISRENDEFKVVFIVLLVNAILLNLRFGMQNRYEFLLKSRKVIIASNIALTVGGILQMVAVSLKLSIVAIAIITAFSSFLSLLIVYYQYRNEFGRLIQRKYSSRLLKELIKESFPLAIAASCAIIYSRCDSIMIGNMLTKADVGVYAIAVKLISVANIAIVPIRESVYPNMIKLYATDLKQYENKYIQITAILAWICLIGIAFSFIILPYALKILKPEYSKAFPIYRVYVIASFFMYNAGLRAGHYTLINRGSVLMYSQIISVIFNIAMNIVLIHTMGIYGAATATVITQCISLLVSNLFFGKTGRDVLLWQLKGMNPIYIFKKMTS